MASLLALASTIGRNLANDDAALTAITDDGETKMGRRGFLSVRRKLKSYDELYSKPESQPPTRKVERSGHTLSLSAHSSILASICECSERPIAEGSVQSFPSCVHPASSTSELSGPGGRSSTRTRFSTAHQIGTVLLSASGNRCKRRVKDNHAMLI